MCEKTFLYWVKTCQLLWHWSKPTIISFNNVIWYLHGNSAVIKPLTGSWLWSAKGFPFFLFDRFKGINQPQSTPFDFSFFVSTKAGRTQKSWGSGNALVSLLLTVQEEKVCKKSQDVLEAWSDGTVALCGTRTELFVQTIQSLFGFFFSSSLSLSPREERINILQLQILAAFVYARKHI